MIGFEDELVNAMAKQIAEEIDKSFFSSFFILPAMNYDLPNLNKDQFNFRYSKKPIRSEYYGVVKIPDDLIKSSIDHEKFPHECPKCKSPAYIGLSTVECSNGGCG